MSGETVTIKKTLKEFVEGMAKAFNDQPIGETDQAEFDQALRLTASFSQPSPSVSLSLRLRNRGWIICPPLPGITTPEPQEALQEGEEKFKVGGSA